MKEEIERAVEVLRRGGIILYPTDTVWGIGCDATDETAVERVYQLKRSCNKKGMIVLTESIDRVGCYFRNVPAVAWDLLECADKPLTLILPGACGVAKIWCRRRERLQSASPTMHSAGTCCTDSAGRWYRPRRTSPARLPRKGSAILPKRYVRVSITRSISAAKALPPARHPPSSCSERMEK